jgi:hypothetical protein
MNQLEIIKKLGELYKEYGIYPQDRYQKDCALQTFLHTHTEHHFSKEASILLDIQPVQSERVGADLPYWGKKYFSDQSGKRYFLISQDSNSLDAGSIVFYANLMDTPMKNEEVKDYISSHSLTPFKSWSTAKKFIIDQLNIDIDFLFITDAKKVYPEGKLNENAQVKQTVRQKWLKNNVYQSRELLRREISLAKPDVIVALGNSALELLNANTAPQSWLLENDQLIQPLEKPISFSDGELIEKFVYSPFPSNANRKYLNEHNIGKVKRSLEMSISKVNMR